jgi:hypothetical protein
MGMTKKMYIDWCEENDRNPDDVIGNTRWTEEFEAWLEQLSKTDNLNNSSLPSEDEIIRMEMSQWVQGELDLAQSNGEKNV